MRLRTRSGLLERPERLGAPATAYRERVKALTSRRGMETQCLGARFTGKITLLWTRGSVYDRANPTILKFLPAPRRSMARAGQRFWLKAMAPARRDRLRRDGNLMRLPAKAELVRGSRGEGPGASPHLGNHRLNFLMA